MEWKSMREDSIYSSTTRERVRYLASMGDKLICDADTHISDLTRLPASLANRLAKDPDYFHGKPIGSEELLAEMDLAGVDVSLIWQNPAATEYPGIPGKNYEALYEANKYIADSAAAHPNRFLPAGWIDPKALGKDKAIELAKRCVDEFNFPIVKLNPAQNAFPIDSDVVIECAQAIASTGAIPAFHFGADTEFTPAEGLERLAISLDPSPLIAVHMGGGGASYLEAEELYQEARALGLRRKNIFYVFSAKRDTHMESDLISYQIAGEPYSRNIACGSDAPYGRQCFNFGGFRGMFAGLSAGTAHSDPRVRTNPELFSVEALLPYLGRNLVDLVLAAYGRIGFKVS
jgi:predicted TIM-barrel fold metal-dependent hydrolase